MKLQEAQRRLRRRYVDGLQAKIQVLQLGIRQSDNAEGRDSLRRLAHQISGSAASFGFPELGDLARAVESADDEALRERAEVLVRELAAIVRGDQSSEVRVLIVDDDEELCDALEQILDDGMRQTSRASSVAEARALLAQQDWDLVLLDIGLQDDDGRQLLIEMRASERHADAPVVVLSGKTGSLVRNECIAYGVDGFVEKPVDLDLVPALVDSAVSRSRVFREEAYIDDLTQVQNRSGFRLAFEKVAALCRRNSRNIALAVIDLDHFKALNDDFGHDVGDQALRIVANCLAEGLRRTDVIGRWGGEEFVVAMPQSGADGAIKALRQVAQALKKRPLSAEWPRRITFSAGVTELGAKDSLDMAVLRADHLLYAAKRAGRDRILHTVPAGVEEFRPHVLVVEDDLDIARLLLRDLGVRYETTHLADGGDVLPVVESGNFDLILLDHNLPNRSGVDLIGDLRGQGVSCPLVLLTAADSVDLVEKAFDAGANDYLTKPYRRRELLARVARYVDGVDPPSTRMARQPV